jgi:coenzyme Q-binding protein COQ10
MPRFETSRAVKHAAADMFALVADVEKYPEFLPLCEGLVVRGRDVRPDGSTLLIADMTVGYKVFRETFSSRVTLDPAQKLIRVEYLDGPFEHLDNRWSFVDTSAGQSKVGFFIDYAFRSRTLALVMGSVFERAVNKYTEAFMKRADIIYGVK